MLIARRQFLASPVAMALAVCGHGEAMALVTPGPARQPLDPSIGAAYEGRLPFGAAVRPEQLRDPRLAAFIKHHFRVLVAENAMKPDTLAPVEGEYRFEQADEIVAFAQGHGLRLRGHTLVWHQQSPAWMFRDAQGREVGRDLLAARLERYVTDVVSHFKGTVFAWDVVNEAYQFDEGPGMQVDARGMRMSDWRRIIGPDYIEIAFRAAAKADPDALLFYNDYETQNPRKVAAIVAMVRDFQSRGIKIDGVGHQSHCARLWPQLSAIDAALTAIAATGVTQHVTELDVALNDRVDGTRVTAATPALLMAQAERYRELMALFLRRRSEIGAVLVWGIGDAYTWLTHWPTDRFEAPLLFDTSLRPKPAYQAVMDVARL